MAYQKTDWANNQEPAIVAENLNNIEEGVEDADQHAANTDIHVTAAEKEQWTTKQDKLVSGKNIKTINNQPILGDGNIAIEGADLPLEMHDGVLCWIVAEE